MIRTPLLRSAGLKEFAAVWPLTTGSVSSISQTTFSGSESR